MLNGNTLLTTLHSSLGIPIKAGGIGMLGLGILGILGGLCSFKRRFWCLALAGSVANVIAPHGIMGLVATIFVYMSRDEFE